jgi:hypothetical protein
MARFGNAGELSPAATNQTLSMRISSAQEKSRLEMGQEF